MIYGYFRTSRTAAGQAGMQAETQYQAMADAGVEPGNIFQGVGISGSVLVSDAAGRSVNSEFPQPLTAIWIGPTYSGYAAWHGG